MSNRASVSGPLSSSPSSLSAPAPPPSPPPQREQSDSHLLPVFSSLFQSGKYSDLVIKCQGQKWKAHRAVVCSQSRPLAAAVDGNFRESATGEIDLEEDEPEIIGFLLEYFYTGDVSIDATTVGSSKNPIDLESTPQSTNAELASYERHHPIRGQPPVYQGPAPSMPVGYSTLVNSVQGAHLGSSGSGSGSVSSLPPSSSSRPISNLSGFSPHDILPLPVTPLVNPKNLVTLAAIYITAEMYDVQPLKMLVKQKYESILSTGWNTEHFVNSLKLIYDGTPDTSEPDSLRELAIRTAATHAKELIDRGEFLNLCKERGDLATDVLKASLRQTSASDSSIGSGIGTGIPRCRLNSNHAIHVVSRTFGGQTIQRYMCAVCDSFLD